MSEKNMNFGMAIESLKKGKKVARSGWNGKGMYLFLVFGNSLQSTMNEKYGDGNTGLPILDSIAMKTAQGNVIIGWMASQSNMLANDWFIIE